MKRVSENQSNKSKNVIINKHYTYIKKKFKTVNDINEKYVYQSNYKKEIPVNINN